MSPELRTPPPVTIVSVNGHFLSPAGLFVNALVIPRAKCSVAGAGALRSDSPLKPTPGWTNHLLRQEHT